MGEVAKDGVNCFPNLARLVERSCRSGRHSRGKSVQFIGFEPAHETSLDHPAKQCVIGRQAVSLSASPAVRQRVHEIGSRMAADPMKAIRIAQLDLPLVATDNPCWRTTWLPKVRFATIRTGLRLEATAVSFNSD